MSSIISKLKKPFLTYDGKIVIVQKPNPPLILWGVATLLRLFIKADPVATALSIAGYAGIITWATLELFTGVNYFRRLLGLSMLLFLLIVSL